MTKKIEEREEIFESFEVLDGLKVKGFSCGLDVLF
jgi:hypothetical protein